MWDGSRTHPKSQRKILLLFSHGTQRSWHVCWGRATPHTASQICRKEQIFKNNNNNCERRKGAFKRDFLVADLKVQEITESRALWRALKREGKQELFHLPELVKWRCAWLGIAPLSLYWWKHSQPHPGTFSGKEYSNFTCTSNNKSRVGQSGWRNQRSWGRGEKSSSERTGQGGKYSQTKRAKRWN